MSTATAERRVIDGIQIRELETTASYSMLRGIAVPFGRDADLGWFVEQHGAGSFTKSIAEAAKGLPLLLFHDGRSFPIGVSTEWDDGATSLVGTWRLDGSPEAQRAAQLADDGMLSYMSIGFQPIRSTWTYVEDWNPDLGANHKDRVLREESRLLETSLVTAPAFKEAAVELVRTAEQPLVRESQARQVDAWKAELEQLRNDPTAS